MGTTKHQVAQAVQNHCPVLGVHALHHMGVGADDDVHACGDGRLGHLLLEIVMFGIVFGAPVAGIENNFAGCGLQLLNVPLYDAGVLLKGRLPASAKADFVAVVVPHVHVPIAAVCHTHRRQGFRVETSPAD